jgi:TolA-binding protein
MRLAPAMIALAVGLAAAPARAQLDSREAIALQNQILELRRDLQGLQAQRGAPALPPPARRGGDGGSEIAAQLLDRVAQLEDDVRRLRGQLDEQANSSRRQMDDLSKQVADLNFRLQNSGPPGTPSPAASAPPPASAGLAPSGRRPAELAMQEGNAALARRDYGVAEAAAREVLAGGKGGPRAGDAQFLLAQALMGKRDYAGAAVAYDDAYNRSRTGSRAPDALLGLANALAALNDRTNACGALDKLRAEFPAPRPNVREAAAAARGRSGCP